MDLIPGAENHNSNMEPCMINSSSDKFVADPNIEEFESKLDQLLVSNEMKDFYRKISSSTQEGIIPPWTFFSIDNLIKMTNNYKIMNIKTIDIAFEYLGMGHVRVAFYHPDFNTFLYRNDGGSSGYDREHNLNELKNLDNDQFKNGISFNEFIEEINKKNKEFKEF